MHAFRNTDVKVILKMESLSCYPISPFHFSSPLALSPFLFLFCSCSFFSPFFIFPYIIVINCSIYLFMYLIPVLTGNPLVEWPRQKSPEQNSLPVLWYSVQILSGTPKRDSPPSLPFLKQGSLYMHIRSSLNPSGYLGYMEVNKQPLVTGGYLG